MDSENSKAARLDNFGRKSSSKETMEPPTSSPSMFREDRPRDISMTDLSQLPDTLLDAEVPRDSGNPTDSIIGNKDFVSYFTDGECRDEILSAFNDLRDVYKGKNSKLEEELMAAKESMEKMKSQLMESNRRENLLVMRLNTKEQEVQDLATQVEELKVAMVPNVGTLRSTLLDPAVNFIIQKIKKELIETKKKLESTQNDLNAWKFTPDSTTGKRLMAKCRLLYQENEDLGKMISSGRLAKLESELALQKSLTEEMKKSQSEMDELVQELDEDLDGMQNTIYFLQTQLKESRTIVPQESLGKETAMLTEVNTVNVSEATSE